MIKHLALLFRAKFRIKQTIGSFLNSIICFRYEVNESYSMVILYIKDCTNYLKCIKQSCKSLNICRRTHFNSVCSRVECYYYCITHSLCLQYLSITHEIVQQNQSSRVLGLVCCLNINKLNVILQFMMQFVSKPYF